MNFCFFTEKDTSLVIKINLLENFTNIQTLKIGKFWYWNWFKYFFNKKDRKGKTKLYIFMGSPDRKNDLLDYNNFQPYKKANLVLEGQDYYNGYGLY